MEFPRAKRNYGKEYLTRNSPDPDETRKIAREEASKILRGVNQGQVKTLARSLSRNEDEYNLIMFHYENSIVLTGNLQEDLENAQVLANKKRIRKELDEVQRTIQSKKDEGGGEGAGQKEQAGAPPPKLTPENQKLIQRMRAKWDPKRKLFVTPSGRTWNPKE